MYEPQCVLFLNFVLNLFSIFAELLAYVRLNKAVSIVKLLEEGKTDNETLKYHINTHIHI